MPELRLRPYLPADGAHIARWVRDEETFYRWSAGRYPQYPITGDDITAHYAALCAEDASRYFPLTALDEAGCVVGHLLLRRPGDEADVLRLGFVIVDAERRGCGYGLALVTAALTYAFDGMNARLVTLGVFTQNTPACACYHAAGFTETGECSVYRLPVGEWICREMAIPAERYLRKGEHHDRG